MKGLGSLGVIQASIKQILAPLLIFIPDQAHELPRGMKRERPRPPSEGQAGFFGRSVAFPVIALVAACH
jgi:hypothetical protein